MPDDILSSILSLLPMKDEVKTSVLSTRWRFLWASRPNLEFDIQTMLGTSIIPKDSIQTEKDLALVNSEYVRRVDNLLQLYRAPKIYSFKVSYCIDERSACHLDRWIKSAIAMGVELLEINLSDQSYLSYGFTSRYKHYNFPCLLLSHDGKASSLKHLRLEFSSLVCPPNFNGFNTLVTLELHQVKLNESCLEIFFSSCLLLETLNIRSCTLPTTKLKVIGPCVNLKCLEVSGCFGLEILVSAAKLISFKYCGTKGKFSLCNVPRLKRLFIHFMTLSGVIQLPNDLPGLESLFLTTSIKDKSLPARLASFSNLKQLELQIFHGVDPSWIISIINVVPLLLKLNLNLANSDYTKRKSIREHGCPHHHLKEIEIHGFDPCTGMELVLDLLKNCIALNRMIIDPSRKVCTVKGKIQIWKTYQFVGNEKVSIWYGEEKEKFYEVVDREVPERAGLVTIHLI